MEAVFDELKGRYSVEDIYVDLCILLSYRSNRYGIGLKKEDK